MVTLRAVLLWVPLLLLVLAVGVVVVRGRVADIGGLEPPYDVPDAAPDVRRGPGEAHAVGPRAVGPDGETPADPPSPAWPRVR